MVDQNLLNYIWGYLQQGYDAQVIRNALLQQGYQVQAIDEAFSVIYKQNPQSGQVQQQTHHIGPITIVGVSVVILLVSIGFFLFFMQQSQPVIDPRVDFEPVAPVTPRQPVEPQIPQETRPEPVVPNTTSPPPTPPPSNRPLTPIEIDDMIKEHGATNPQMVSTFCGQINNPSTVNSCYSRLAVAASDQSYCIFVDNIRVRDQCYVSLAQNGIGGVAICNNVQSEMLKTACVTLYESHEYYDDWEEQLEQSREQAREWLVDPGY
ncbi:MAG: hypothetical protein ACMXYC_04975 [Candidatus Woesearchaeota archaeon]